jgi:threonine/homoserine/homoserine lactone efflux protein
MTVAIPAGRLDIFVRYAWLGLAAALPIGPVNVEIARRTLRGGFLAGFALGCGAVTVDMTYALLSGLSLAPLVQKPAIQWTVGIGGFVLLIYLGVQSLRSANKHRASDPLLEETTASARKVVGGGYRTGVLMTLLNPITLIFWFVEVPAQSAITQGTARDVPMMGTGVFIGTISWVIAFCGFLSVLGKWRQRWWLVAADRIGGIMLIALAIYGLWHLKSHSL